MDRSDVRRRLRDKKAAPHIALITPIKNKIHVSRLTISGVESIVATAAAMSRIGFVGRAFSSGMPVIFTP
jgi:hypothetical protein